MRWAGGKAFHPYEYRFFEGGAFPAKLTYENLTAQLNTSFRTWLRFDQLIQAANLTDKERISIALMLCVKQVDEGFPIETLKDGLVWFHGADSLDRSWVFDKPSSKSHKNLFEKLKTGANKKPKSFSLFWDTHSIWSAFRSAFNIDLFEVNLHWWAFMALLNELPENCSISRFARQRLMEQKDVDIKERDAFVINQYLIAVPKGGIFEGDVE